MLRNFLLIFCAAACVHPTAARASDWTYPGGGVFAQLMDRGGSHTTFTLVNLDTVPAPYTLNFFDDNGNPLALNTTAGNGVSLSGTLPVNGSTTFQTNGSASAPLVQGYAVLVTQNTIAGSLVFALPLGSLLPESTCPLDTGTDYIFGVPFDHTTPGTVVGVALANDYGYAPLTISVVAYDETGHQLASSTIPILANAHTAFLLTTEFPALANTKGTIWFNGTDSAGNPAYFNLLGVRATATTFTSIVPIVPADF